MTSQITVMTTIFSSKFNNVTFPALQNQSNESMWKRKKDI